MRVAHLSDLHLGHRVFSRRERGGNLRERDVAAAFHLAIQEVARLAPDLVLVSGDLFHGADPPSTAFLTLTRGIRRLQDLLPGVPVMAIAGECDTPMAPGDPGPVAVLDAVPGVEAAAGAPRAVHLRDLSAHVLLVPHRAVVRPPFPELRPDPGARWNILLVRGHPAGDLRGREGRREPGAETTRRPPEGDHLVLDPDGWDYVALGGPHRMRSWGETVHCAGSLERIGASPWSEAATEKGFLLADLARGRVEVHPLPARPVVDLAPVRVTPEDPGAGTRRLRELLEGFPGGVEGKIVRVRLE
jgi:DNA repair protein SbcD/Mre11